MSTNVSHASATGSASGSAAAIQPVVQTAVGAEVNATSVKVVETVTQTFYHDKFVPNLTKNEPFATYLKQTKGAADVLGAVSRGAGLLARVAPEKAGWAAHVSQVTGQGRAVLAIPSCYLAINRLAKTFEEPKFKVVNAVRDGLDVVSSGACAGSLLVADRAQGALLGAVSGAFKTASDALKLGKEVGKFYDWSNLRADLTEKAAASNHVETAASQTVKSGVDTEYTATALKVGCLVCSVLTGLVAALAFVFKVAFAKEVLLTAAAVSLVGVVLSIASELTRESADVRLVPARDVEPMRTVSRHIAQHWAV